MYFLKCQTGTQCTQTIKIWVSYLLCIDFDTLITFQLADFNKVTHFTMRILHRILQDFLVNTTKFCCQCCNFIMTTDQTSPVRGSVHMSVLYNHLLLVPPLPSLVMHLWQAQTLHILYIIIVHYYSLELVSQKILSSKISCSFILYKRYNLQKM